MRRPLAVITAAALGVLALAGCSNIRGAYSQASGSSVAPQTPGLATAIPAAPTAPAGFPTGGGA